MRQNRIPRLTQHGGNGARVRQRRTHERVCRRIRLLFCDRFALFLVVGSDGSEAGLGEFCGGGLTAGEVVGWSAVDEAAEVGDEEGVLDVG